MGTTTTNTFQVMDETAATLGMTLYTSGGNSYCVKYGCLYYYFTSAAGGHNLYQVNNCPTERLRANAFTDVAPSTTRFNYNYVSGGSDRITQTIQPLTSNKTTLHNLANSLTAANSTAGHLGLAWGWYMISPNFGYLWPTASQPAAYGRANLIKAVVLMTTPTFSTATASSRQTPINGTSSQKINCTAPDGTSQNQAVALCNAIKAWRTADTVLYTVGFDLEGDTSNAINLLQNCATSPADFFQATAGTSDLTTDFTAIAQDLNNLRISK